MSKIISDFRRPSRRTPHPEVPPRKPTAPSAQARPAVYQQRRQAVDIAPQKPAPEPAPTPGVLPPVVAPQATEEPLNTPHKHTRRHIRRNKRQKPDQGTARRKFRLPFKLTKKRIILGIIILVILIAGGVLTYLNYTASKITGGGTIIDLITPGAPLKTDSEGRTNVLIFGSSQDDAAHQNAEGGGGLWLTDSIMLVSIDKDNNTAKMVSIPRDLWVELDQSCDVGTSAKINAVYECASGLVNAPAKPGANYSNQDKTGATALMKKITTVTGITPQYYVHVNYSVLKQAVDAVGGIDVNIEGDGADGIYDTNFDWNCGKAASYTCKNVYYPKDGTYHLDGLHALYLARARADAGLYSYKDFGLARGDFDRQINQQKIATALRTKAQSAGVLANPIKVFSLLNALGDNVTSDITTSEMKTFISTVKKLPADGIKSIDLNGDTPVVKTGTYAGQSIVLATSGVYDYSSMISLIAKKFSTNPATAEEASIAVYNGGDTAGAASKLQTKLASAGLSVDVVGNASSVGGDRYTIYSPKSSSFPKTIDYLTQTLKDTSLISSAAPTNIPASNADIVIVINH